MAKFMYNNVWVQYARTIQFEMSNEYSTDGVDKLWTVYRIRVRGFVVASQGQFPGPAGNPPGDTVAILNSSIAANTQSIKALLETPRAVCSYTVNGNTLVSIPGGNGLGPIVDAHFGPMPQPCTAAYVIDGLFLVECGFEVRVVDCAADCPASPVVSLRYSQQETFNETWHTRLTTKGRLVVRSDLSTSADTYRGECRPDILDNFVRTHSEYTLDSTLTVLDFSYVDEERDYMPPALVAKASGQFIVNVSSGARRKGQVNLRLQGIPSSSRSALLAKAIVMAFSKLLVEGFQGGAAPIISGSFSEELFENVVNVQMQADLSSMMAAGGVAAGGNGWALGGAAAGGLVGFAAGGPIGGLIGAGLGAIAGGAIGGGGPPPAAPATVPGVMSSADNVPGTIPVARGLSPKARRRIAGLLGAAFGDPCACAAMEVELRTKPLTPETEISPSPIPAKITVSPTPLPPYSSTPVITDAAPYDFYKIESRYKYDNGIIQMPGTGAVPGTSGQSGTPQNAAFIQMHGGKATLEVTWAASRRGLPPVIPAYKSIDANWVALGGDDACQITPESIDYSADLINPIHTVSGRYVYGAVNPSLVNVIAPIPPFLAPVAAAAAQQSASTYSNQPLWNFVGASNPNNPWSNPVVGQAPPNTIPNQLGTQPITGVIAAIQQMTQQELNGSTGDSATGGGLLPTAPVNA